MFAVVGIYAYVCVVFMCEYKRVSSTVEIKPHQS